MKHTNIKIIHFVRHGKTSYNQNKQIQGSSDIPLSDIGIAQAQEFNSIDFLPTYDIAYHSSLVRTKETLDILLEKVENKPKVLMSDLIKERAYGVFEGLKDCEIEEKYPDTFKKWKLDENTPIPDAETIDSIVDKILEFITLIEKSEYTNVLAVTHSGVLFALYKYITQTKLGERPQDIYFANCCSVYLSIKYENGIRKLEFKFGDKIY